MVAVMSPSWVSAPLSHDSLNLPFSPVLETVVCSVSSPLLQLLEDLLIFLVKVLLIQLCPTLCTPIDCSQPGSSDIRLLCPWDSPGKNTRGLAISFSRGSSCPIDQTQVSCTAGIFLTNWASFSVVFRAEWQFPSFYFWDQKPQVFPNFWQRNWNIKYRIVSQTKCEG